MSELAWPLVVLVLGLGLLGVVVWGARRAMPVRPESTISQAEEFNRKLGEMAEVVTSKLLAAKEEVAEVKGRLSRLEVQRLGRTGS